MSSLPPNVTNPTDNEFTVVEDIRLRRMLEMSRDLDAPAQAKPLFVAEAEEKPKPKSRWQKLLQLPRRTLLLVAGVVALVVVALLAGLAISSLNRPVPPAWMASPAYEKMYLTMVADKYAKTGDMAQLQRDLAGASPEQVAQVLQTMQRETVDTTTRQRLTVLADAVRPPVTQTSYVPTLFNQPAFLFSLFLSLTPMFVAFGLVVGPYLRERFRPVEHGASKSTTDTMSIQEAEPPIDPNAPVAGASVAVEPTPEAAAAAAAAAEEEQKKKEEEEEEEEQQQDDSGGLGDLASLFEEEDTSLAALENFCKGLPDVNVDVLISNGKSTVVALKDAIAQRG